jgi:hypothetical protein
MNCVIFLGRFCNRMHYSQLFEFSKRSADPQLPCYWIFGLIIKYYDNLGKAQSIIGYQKGALLSWLYDHRYICLYGYNKTVYKFN